MVNRLEEMPMGQLVMAVALAWLGCGGDNHSGTELDAGERVQDAGGQDAEGPDDMAPAAYLRDLPSWAEFSPPLPEAPPAPIEGAEVVMTEEVVEQVVPPEDGQPADPDNPLTRPVTYDCMQVPYSLTETPQRLISSDPNRDVLYPGAMLQGRTHRDGSSIGDLLPLTIPKRAPVRVSIPDLANAGNDNFRLVQPNQAEVGQAVGDIVGHATAADIDTPSSVSFEMTTYHSERQFALQAKMSARYLGFRASASGSVERDASETTVAVQFTQRMYTVAVEAPGSGPEDFFAEDFTADDLQKLVDAGKLGPDNLPVYVSSVTYGRMMTFALTSSASESEIKAALRASYRSFAGSASGSLNARQKEILSSSKIVLSTLGGDATDAIKVVRSGDWSQYFEKNAALSTAVPLSYTFKNVGDGSIANVSEATEYTVKTCTPRSATPGLLELRDMQAHLLDLDQVSEVIVADENGDGLDDLIFNDRSGANKVHVLHASADGTFVAGPSFTHPESAKYGAWADYQLRAGDVDGDGRDDLAWHYDRVVSDQRRNVTYVALAGHADDGGYVPADLFERADPAISEGSYTFFLGDLNGDGQADLLLSSVPVRDTNYLHVGLSTGDGGFRMEDGTYQLLGSKGWGPYDPYVGDFNGDGLVDVLFNAVSATSKALWGTVVEAARNDVWMFAADASQRDASLNDYPLSAPMVAGSPFQWPDMDEKYQGSLSGRALLIGDIDGRTGLDLAWAKLPEDGGSGEYTVTLESALWSEGDRYTRAKRADTFVLRKSDPDSDSKPDAPDDLRMLLADVGGDDKDDFVINELSGVDGGAVRNLIHVGLSNGDGSFDHSTIVQELTPDPQETSPWSQFQLWPGRFGGSSKTDLVWVLKTNRTHVYVAIAK